MSIYLEFLALLVAMERPVKTVRQAEEVKGGKMEFPACLDFLVFLG